MNTNTNTNTNTNINTNTNTNLFWGVKPLLYVRSYVRLEAWQRAQRARARINGRKAGQRPANGRPSGRPLAGL